MRSLDYFIFLIGTIEYQTVMIDLSYCYAKEIFDVLIGINEIKFQNIISERNQKNELCRQDLSCKNNIFIEQSDSYQTICVHKYLF